MAIPTNGIQLVRISGALFNQQLSASDYSDILAANKTVADLSAWANSMVSLEFKNKTTTDVAAALLTNVGLSSVAGLQNWVVGQLNAGGGMAKAGETVLAMLNDFSNMSTTDATYGSAVTTFNTKVANAQTLSQTAGSAGGTYAAVSTTTPPTTLALTTGADSRTLGSGNDTINALFSSTTGMTFGSNDILDGGAGSDTLFVQVGATGVHGPASLSNIETITTNFSAAGTVNLLGATGVTTIESNGSSADAAFTNIGSAATALRVANTANSANFGFTAAAVAGSADTANVTLNAVTGGTLTLTSGFETLSLTPTGAADTLTGLSLGTSSASTVRVAGDQALNIGTVATPVTLPTTVTNFDASGNTASGAGVVATFGANTTSTSITGGTGNDTFNITNITTSTINVAGGAGNDIIIYNSAISAVTTISGGDGTADVLVTTASSAENYAAPSTRTITGFERLTLSTPGSSGASFTLANVDSGIATITLGAGTAAQGTGIGAAGAFTATNGSYSITGPAGTLAVNLGGTLGGALTLTDTGTAITDSATVTVSQSTATNNVLAGQNISSVGYETLTVSSGSTVTAPQTLGTVGVTVDTGGASVVNFTGVNNLSVGAITGVTVSASGMTGAGTFTQTAAAGSTTTSITGTGNNDVILGGSASSTLSGGAGADTITGGAGNDSISGGDGSDQINGGAGRDTITGGAGADTFVFAANTAAVTQSNQSNPDTITDFTSGTDKLSITNITSGAPSKFLGNFANFTTANSAAATDATPGIAFFVTGENNLYVQAVAGTQGANDTVISLSGVTSLTAADLLIGAQGSGNTLSLTAAAANLSNTASTNASTVTTTTDDAISSTAAFLAASTIDGGLGNDTLTISTAPTGAFTLATAGTSGATVSNVEVISLTAGAPNGVLTMPNTVGLRVTNASSSAAAQVTLGSGANQTFSASGAGANTVVLGAALQAITGGTGPDGFTASIANADRATIAGGLGSDTLAITGSTSTPSLTIISSGVPSAITTGTSGVAQVLMTGVETLNYTQGTAGTLTVSPDANLTVNYSGASDATIVGTGQTITVGAVSGQAYTLSGSSNFAISGNGTGALTHSAISGVTAGVLTSTAGTSSYTITNNSASLDVLNASALGATVTLAGTGGGFSVTGLGSAASAVLTESTAMTSGIAVATAGTNAAAITLASTTNAHGAVSITQAGTGTVTLTTVANAGTIAYTATGTSGDLIMASSAANPNIINYTATQGAHLVHLGNSTTGAADLIVLSTGNDTVIGGLGADDISLGAGGTDVVRVIAAHTGTAVGFTSTSAVPTTTFFAGGADIIRQIGATDQIQFGSAVGTTGSLTALPTTAAGTAIIRNGGSLGGSNAGDIAMIVGNYTSSTGFFTPSVTGTDTAVVYDSDGTGTATSTYSVVILVGYVDTGAVDTASTAGVLTLNA